MSPWQAFKRVVGLIATRPVELVMAAGLVLVLSLVELPLPIFMALLIDSIIPANDITALFVIGGLLFIARSSASVFQVFQNYLVARMTSRFAIQLRNQMIHKILRLPFAKYADSTAKGMVTRLVQDVNQTESFASETVSFLIRPFASFMIMLTVMLIWNWVLALYCLLTIPAVMLTTKLIRRRMRDASRLQRKRIEALEVTASEALAGIRSIRACGAEDNFQLRFAQESAEIERASIHYEVWIKAASQTIAAIRAISTFGFILMAGYQVFGGHLTIGGFVALHTLSLGIARPITQLMHYVTTIGARSVAVERVDEVIAEVTEHDGHDHVAYAFDRGHVTFESVNLSFGDSQVLRDVSLDIQPGETVALVGPSGAGKTSLTNVLLGLYPADKGRVTVDGHEVHHADLISLRRGMGIVFQDPQMFNNTVSYNLRIAKPEATDADMWNALRRANADEFIRSLPDQLDSVIGVNGIKLSGGQKQRLSIARTLLADPQVIILDEATSSLDSTTEQEIQGAIDETLRDRTSIVIAHRLSTILNADRIAVFDKGEIVAVGSHRQLLADRQPLYTKLYETQTEFISEKTG